MVSICKGSVGSAVSRGRKRGQNGIKCIKCERLRCLKGVRGLKGLMSSIRPTGFNGILRVLGGLVFPKGLFGLMVIMGSI